MKRLIARVIVWSQDPEHPDDATKKIRVPESPGAENQESQFLVDNVFRLA